ncbi:MAG: hypothetical protein ACK5LX_08875 [Oscillospiraceae bacterium]
MLTIGLKTEKELLLPYCKKAKLPYNGGIFLYLAENRGEKLAAGLFEIAGNSVSIRYYESQDPDPFLLDGILRAGFNYAGDQSIEKGVLPEEFRQIHKELFASLNYPPEPTFNIDNFFAKYKNCITP